MTLVGPSKAKQESLTESIISMPIYFRIIVKNNALELRCDIAFSAL